ncbi:hypothetical protein MASR2M17_12580 [Aminivibrio sp.]
MPVIILGGIYGGVFTPTEAAVVAVVYGFAVGFLVYRELRLSKLKDILVTTAVSTAMIMFIIAASSVFSWIITAQKIPQAVASAMLAISSNPVVILTLSTCSFCSSGHLWRPWPPSSSSFGHSSPW